MPPEGYADPVMNDGPRFHSDMPVSELIGHITRAIEASDVSSTPLVTKTMDGVTIIKMSRPSTGPLLCAGAQGKLDSQGDQMRDGRMIAQILGKGYVRKLRFLLQVLLSSSRSLVKPDLGNGKGSGLTRGLIRVYIYPF